MTDQKELISNNLQDLIYFNLKKQDFLSKTRSLLQEHIFASGHYERRDSVFKIFSVADEYSEIILSSTFLYSKPRYLKCLKDKLLEFYYELSTIYKDKLNNKIYVNKCKKYLNKFFKTDFQCQAYNRKGTLCKNFCDKDNQYCDIHHDKYILRIMNILEDSLGKDVSLICVSLIFPDLNI